MCVGGIESTYINPLRQLVTDKNINSAFHEDKNMKTVSNEIFDFFLTPNILFISLECSLKTNQETYIP